jgi:AraC-like DNA-binding protein
VRKTYDEVYDWFVEVLFPMHRQISEEIGKNSTKVAVHLVCNHIKNDPGAPHSLTDCAELVGMSPSYLSRVFKQEVGMSFVEYVMEYKVEEAKRLLTETEYSVTDIAIAVGYSERNLNRAFQRYVGMSPKQYRISLR